MKVSTGKNRSSCFPRAMWAGLLLCSLFLPSQILSETVPAGDLAPYGNRDGQLNAADLLILQRMVTGELDPTAEELLIGDVAPLNSPNTVLDVGDIVVLQRALLGLVNLPPVELGGPSAPILDPVTSPTNVNPITVTGTAEANQEIKLYVNGQPQGAEFADGVGSFSFTVVLTTVTTVIEATAVEGTTESEFSNALSIEYLNEQGGVITQNTTWGPGIAGLP